MRRADRGPTISTDEDAVPGEVRRMLEVAGFEDVVVHGEHERRPPGPDDDFVVFAARR